MPVPVILPLLWILAEEGCASPEGIALAKVTDPAIVEHADLLMVRVPPLMVGPAALMVHGQGMPVPPMVTCQALESSRHRTARGWSSMGRPTSRRCPTVRMRRRKLGGASAGMQTLNSNAEMEFSFIWRIKLQAGWRKILAGTADMRGYDRAVGWKADPDYCLEAIEVNKF